MFFFEGGRSERAITEQRYAYIVVSVVATGEIRAVLTIHDHAGKTPIRTELRCYFREVLKSRSEKQSTRCRTIELSCAEIVTSYVVVERIK